MKRFKCKYCGAPNLVWKRACGVWRLYTGDLLHQCGDMRFDSIPSPEITSYLSRVPAAGSWAARAKRARSA